MKQSALYSIACEVFSTGSVFPFINDFKLTYEGREIITFPVKKKKNRDNLISLASRCFDIY